MVDRNNAGRLGSGLHQCVLGNSLTGSNQRFLCAGTTLYSVVCGYVCASVCECMCVLCVRDMYIQRCRHAPKHTHIHILIQTLMDVKVSNIIVCNQHVPDPNKHEQTPNVLRERP